MRARNIKPGFFTNEDLVECCYESRLLYIGLWMMVDCEGKMEYRPKQIKMKLFPADDINVESCIAELRRWSFIRLYHCDGIDYLDIPTFTRHQNPHHREKPKGYPDYSLGQALGQPEASPRQAWLNPESLILNPDPGSRNPESGTLNPDTSKPHSAKSDTKPFTYDPDFEEWWNAFPVQRRKNKRKAHEIWVKLRRRNQLPDQDHMMANITTYAMSAEVREGYAKMPTTFLNQGCFDDDYEPDDGLSVIGRANKTAAQIVLDKLNAEAEANDDDA